MANEITFYKVKIHISLHTTLIFSLLVATKLITKKKQLYWVALEKVLIIVSSSSKNFLFNWNKFCLFKNLIKIITYHLELSIWSANPGVSVIVNFRQIPFSSMTVLKFCYLIKHVLKTKTKRVLSHYCLKTIIQLHADYIYKKKLEL